MPGPDDLILPPTAAELEAQMERLALRTDLDEATRTRMAASFASAAEQIRAAVEWAEQAAEFDRFIAEAPAQHRQLEQELAGPIQDPAPPTESELLGRSLSEIEQNLARIEALLSAARTEQQQLEQEPARRATRRGEIPRELAALQQRLAGVNEQLAVPMSEGADAQVYWAQRQAVLATRLALQRQIDALEREVQSYDARRDVLTLRRDLAARRVMALEELVSAWRQALGQRRALEARRQVLEARRDLAAVADAPTAIREIARQNLALAEQLAGEGGLSEKIAEAERQTLEADRLVSRLRVQYPEIRRRVESGPLTGAIGVLLRRIREELPPLHAHVQRLRSLQVETSDVQFRLFDLRDAEGWLIDLPARAKETVAALPDVVPDQSESLQQVALNLLQRQRESTRELIAYHDAYLSTLSQLERAEVELIGLIEEFARFVDEHIFWLRSTTPWELGDFRRAADGLRRLLAPEGWREVASVLWTDIRTRPLLAIIALAGAMFWGASLRRLRIQLDVKAELVKRLYSDRFRHTLEILLVTVLLAGLGPAVLRLVGTRLLESPASTDFTRAVGDGFHRAAWILFTIGFIRHLCRPKGLGDAHFRWRTRNLATLRQNLVWLTIAALPLAFVVAATSSNAGDPAHNALGRMAFTVAMAALAFFAARVLRPAGGILEDLLARNRGGWLDRLRYVWYSAIVAAPLALGAAAILGYYYTAIQLERRAVSSIWLIVLAIVADGLTRRWLFVARRRLAVEQARKKRSAQAIGDDTAGRSDPGAPPVDETPDVDLVSLDAQTRQLIRTLVGAALAVGFWFVWADMLPALRALDRFEIYPDFGPTRAALVVAAPTSTWAETPDAAIGVRLPGTFVRESLAAADEQGASEAPTPPVDESPAGPVAQVLEDGRVTLGDVVLTVGVVVLTILVARNIPGLMEIVILQHLPLRPSVRFAVTTISRYVITAVGVVIAFGMLGIGWSKVQWLVAALTLGLSFGLQEIFANFISGLIILFEQPIRVGDTVTVSNVSGRVTRIRIRATTILDWDRKELLVPNKEFITGQVINWTLSDPTLRVLIPVGIVYGSDTELAERILRDVARENSNVLEDPAPSVYFVGFGENSLNFELRVYIPHIDFLLQTRHELNRAIDERFRAAGIEIARPQRHLQLRADATPLEVVVRRDGSRTKADSSASNRAT